MLFANFGSMIQSVGAAWLMTSITPYHQLVALVSASVTIPIMLLALFAGAIADALDRRLIMLASQSGMFVASAALSILTWQGLISPGLLLLFTFLVGVGTAINMPAWQASLRMQLPMEQIPAAISLNSISFNLARSVGPALGALLITLSGPALNFAVNALSYIWIIIVLLRWKPVIVVPPHEPLLAAIRRGINYSLTTTMLRNTLVRSAAFGVGAASLPSLMPLIARELIRGDQMSYGLLVGSYGLGSIVSAMAVPRMRELVGANHSVMIATTAYAIGTLGAAWSSSLALTLPFTFLAGIGWVMGMMSFSVTIQMGAPDAIVGRTISIYHSCVFGAMALAAWGWGALSDQIGLRPVLTLGAAVLAVSLLLVWLVPMPGRMRRGYENTD